MFYSACFAVPPHVSESFLSSSVTIWTDDAASNNNILLNQNPVLVPVLVVVPDLQIKLKHFQIFPTVFLCNNNFYAFQVKLTVLLYMEKIKCSWLSLQLGSKVTSSVQVRGQAKDFIRNSNLVLLLGPVRSRRVRTGYSLKLPTGSERQEVPGL